MFMPCFALWSMHADGVATGHPSICSCICKQHPFNIKYCVNITPMESELDRQMAFQQKLRHKRQYSTENIDKCQEYPVSLY